ncbi:NERD domain-containing protein [Nonomuraea jabiensis]|uniref:NERD domain-containing protein n=1 Tax=Nonomuraea jabiensis TaxID=882448 RepID=UPI0034258A31
MKLPDSEPWRAWSNFTFTAQAEYAREVDLLVVTPGGVHLIEPKDWHGNVTIENGTWVQTTHRSLGAARQPAPPGRQEGQGARVSPGQVRQTRLGRRGQTRDCAAERLSPSAWRTSGAPGPP